MRPRSKPSAKASASLNWQYGCDEAMNHALEFPEGLKVKIS